MLSQHHLSVWIAFTKCCGVHSDSLKSETEPADTAEEIEDTPDAWQRGDHRTQLGDELPFGTDVLDHARRSWRCAGAGWWGVAGPPARAAATFRQSAGARAKDDVKRLAQGVRTPRRTAEKRLDRFT